MKGVYEWKRWLHPREAVLVCINIHPSTPRHHALYDDIPKIHPYKQNFHIAPHVISCFTPTEVVDIVSLLRNICLVAQTLSLLCAASDGYHPSERPFAKHHLLISSIHSPPRSWRAHGSTSSEARYPPGSSHNTRPPSTAHANPANS